jgi:hypothetical protein
MNYQNKLKKYIEDLTSATLQQQYGNKSYAEIVDDEDAEEINLIAYTPEKKETLLTYKYGDVHCVFEGEDLRETYRFIGKKDFITGINYTKNNIVIDMYGAIVLISFRKYSALISANWILEPIGFEEVISDGIIGNYIPIEIYYELYNRTLSIGISIDGDIAYMAEITNLGEIEIQYKDNSAS